MSDSDALETSAGGSVSDGSDAAAGVGLAPPRRLRSYRMKEDFGDQGRRRSAALERKRAHRNALTAYTRRLALAEEDLTGESFGDLGEADDDGGDWGYADDHTDVAPVDEDYVFQHKWKDVDRPLAPAELFKNHLMLSEWLAVVPDADELAAEWYVVPCPAGKRRLVTARSGVTVVRSRHGRVVRRLPSDLPGGNRRRSNKSRNFCILDTIYSADAGDGGDGDADDGDGDSGSEGDGVGGSSGGNNNGTYFVLDCMAWKGFNFMDNDTEFRFAWHTHHVAEGGAHEVSRKNPCAFVSLPFYECTEDGMRSAFVDDLGFERSGFLFYRRATPYIIGRTPNVCWASPDLFVDIFGDALGVALANMGDTAVAGAVE